jgi:predicted DNA-binding transcriptional regulator AlpA
VKKVATNGGAGHDEDADLELLTAPEVSTLCGLPVSTLHEYATRRELGLSKQGPPHVRLGARRRRWLRSDVRQWILSNRVGG